MTYMHMCITICVYAHKCSLHIILLMPRHIIRGKGSVNQLATLSAKCITPSYSDLIIDSLTQFMNTHVCICVKWKRKLIALFNDTLITFALFDSYWLPQYVSMFYRMLVVYS